MAKFTVTEALVKLKLSDKKINDAREAGLVGYTTSRGNKAVPAGFPNVDEYKKEVKRRLDSSLGLINFRDNLRKEVINSNARTVVKVGTKEYTVAQAIELKQGLAYKKALRDKMQKQLATLDQQVNQNNASLDARADQHLVQLFQNSTVAQTEKDSARKHYIDNNTAYVETHEDVRKAIQRLTEEIDEFESNVDVALSVVNANTFVEVPN